MGGEPYTAVGRIVKTHGLNGEVSVKMHAEASADSLTGLEVWFVPPTTSVRSAKVRSVRPGPKGPVMAFDGIDDVDSARELPGREILVDTDLLPEPLDLGSDPADAIGMMVIDEKRGLLGEVVDVIVTGANDVWVVEGAFGEVLIPVIDDVVCGYDEGSDTAHVRLLRGLIEGEDADE